MDWLKRHGTNMILVLALIVGLGLLVYPTFADYWNSFTQSRAIVSYAEAVASLDAEKYEAIWNSALAYNRSLAEIGIQWIPDEALLADYESQLNVTGTGSMGYIEIPKINVSLPIYHGIEEAVLQTSIGHLAGTSLPAGGESSHCALSGHRGLPSAKLFSDLDKLVEGDRFILTVLDQTLTYEVDQIRIVEPTDVGDLAIEEGQDYCTLITCTPYGINSHRMLVRGHRVENDRVVEIRITADALLIDPIYVAPAIAIPVIILLVIWLFIMTSGRGKSKHGAHRTPSDRKGAATKPVDRAASAGKDGRRGAAKGRGKPDARAKRGASAARRSAPKKTSLWSSLWVQPGQPASHHAASHPKKRKPIAYPKAEPDGGRDRREEDSFYTKYPDTAKPLVVQVRPRLEKQSNEVRF